MIMPTLTGKTALVTGASRGMGRASALALAAAGAQVLVHYGRGANEADGVVAEIRKAGCSQRPGSMWRRSIRLRCQPSEIHCCLSHGIADRLPKLSRKSVPAHKHEPIEPLSSRTFDKLHAFCRQLAKLPDFGQPVFHQRRPK